MSIPIVVDEWFFHDLWGENGDDKQRGTFQFIYKVVELGDKFVIVGDSPFEEKTRILMKKSEGDTKLKGMSQFFRTAIIMDASRTHFLRQDEIRPVPKYITQLVPESDHYLFQAHLKVRNSLIVTTDGRWDPSIYKRTGLNIQMRDPFIEAYLKKTI